MQNRFTIYLFSCFLFLFSNSGFSDARLEKQLNLDMDVAKQVQEIRKKYRLTFNAKRQELHREQRKLRRAKADFDSKTLAEQEKTTAKLREELKQIRLSENEEIRKLLNEEQREEFEEILEQRQMAYGSSRDEKEF